MQILTEGALDAATREFFIAEGVDPDAATPATVAFRRRQLRAAIFAARLHRAVELEAVEDLARRAPFADAAAPRQVA